MFPFRSTTDPTRPARCWRSNLGPNKGAFPLQSQVTGFHQPQLGAGDICTGWFVEMHPPEPAAQGSCEGTFPGSDLETARTGPWGTSYLPGFCVFPKETSLWPLGSHQCPGLPLPPTPPVAWQISWEYPTRFYPLGHWHGFRGQPTVDPGRPSQLPHFPMVNLKQKQASLGAGDRA